LDSIFGFNGESNSESDEDELEEAESESELELDEELEDELEDELETGEEGLPPFCETGFLTSSLRTFSSANSRFTILCMIHEYKS
jgi:hypothetical protein